MEIQVTTKVTLKGHSRGLEELTLIGDAPAVAAVVQAVMADNDRFGHPNEVKLDFLRGHQGKGFVASSGAFSTKGAHPLN